MPGLGWFAKERAVRRLFDRKFYLRSNPDVMAAGLDPVRHYLKHGVRELRQPHPLFDPAHYLGCCPDARSAENPLLHFLLAGETCPATHPLFDCEAYRSAHPGAGNPLLDYLSAGRQEALEGSQFSQC